MVLGVSSLVCRCDRHNPAAEITDLKTHQVGFVGGGQLARMAGQAASALGLSMVVLAEDPADAACAVASEVLIGSPLVAADLRALSQRCEVITFDHEQVDLDIVAALADDGVVIRPGPGALELAVDKATMRQALVAAGLPVPAHQVIDPGPDAAALLVAFGQAQGWPCILKTARGGYDGKGVWTINDAAQAAQVVSQLAGTGRLLAEELVPLDAELAVMVARRPNGDSLAWPAVETAQVGGVCREVLIPGRLGADVVAAASTLGRQVADLAGAVGVMAVELFWSEGRLVVNEVATRPHNSGHWTIEGAVTSQFENHLRAVLDLPLGATDPCHREVASVNIFGGDHGEDPALLLPEALAVEGAHVHLYGKGARPGRKLGHVTVCGDNSGVVRERAWAAALALGTPRPAGLSLPEGLAS
jgi:5-(carboxyamino)imidazole ribonucleotide synthase